MASRYLNLSLPIQLHRMTNKLLHRMTNKQAFGPYIMDQFKFYSFLRVEKNLRPHTCDQNRREQFDPVQTSGIKLYDLVIYLLSIPRVSTQMEVMKLYTICTTELKERWLIEPRSWCESHYSQTKHPGRNLCLHKNTHKCKQGKRCCSHTKCNALPTSKGGWRRTFGKVFRKQLYAYCGPQIAAPSQTILRITKEMLLPGI